MWKCNSLKALEKKVAKIDDELAAIKADQLTIKAGVASLQTQITTLSAALAAGGLTAAQQAALDDVKATADALAGVFAPGIPAPPLNP
jgi:chromosome segregation ATPase